MRALGKTPVCSWRIARGEMIVNCDEGKHFSVKSYRVGDNGLIVAAIIFATTKKYIAEFQLDEPYFPFRVDRS